MYFILAGIILVLGTAVAVMYRYTSRILDRVDEMLDDVLDRRFQENCFNEEKLSRIEAKLFRYLVREERAQNLLAEEKNTIKSLVSDISHQTKTPIANILLYTQLLKEHVKADKETAEIVDQIEVQTQKLNFLINSLVKLSRLENGIVTLQPAPNRIEELFALDDYEKQASMKGICLVQKEFPQELAVFDVKWTREAVSNILDNAIKYTPSGGKITVSAVSYEMFIRIDIQDTGIGMTEEETARIFTRFYRSPRVAAEKGVGIGLYLAREVLNRESGYIKVTSEINKGALFSIFLPRAGTLSKL